MLELLALIAIIGGPFAWLAYQRRPVLLKTVPADFDPQAYGLPPLAQVSAERAGPPRPLYEVKEARAVADACRDGDWKSAASYVEAAGTDWDERWERLELLLQVARQDAAWLDRWQEQQPGSGDAVTVRAQLVLHQAWEIRGSAYAHQVPPERMARFRAMLPEAVEIAEEAARLAPEDPGPWVVMATAARALGYRHDRFRSLWQELERRAPAHYQGHWQGMQYWTEKWHGSLSLMLRFVERTVRLAPTGSPVAGVYLFALDEYTARSRKLDLLRSARVRRSLRAVAESLSHVPANDERLPLLRHKLAHYLCAARLYDEALVQFRTIGPWCGAAPWRDSRDPVAAFELARATAALKSRDRG